ncbi:glycosyltransferase family 2 protein [Niabella terrae]
MQQPLVAIVILNWNGKSFLEEFLPYLVRTRYANFQIVVADNASTDDSIAFLESQYPDIRIIRFIENHGFARGYNLALQQVAAPYYLLLNSDVKVSEDWLQPLVDLLESNKEIAACQPKLLSYKQPRQFEYAGAAGGWLDAYGYPFARGRIFDITEEDRGQFDRAEPIFWASGAALFIRSEVFQHSGGFDDYFFAHQEEIDLCWRVQLMGYQIYCCPSSVVYHVGGGTLPKGNSLKTFLNFRNNNIMIFKNMRGWRRWYVLLLRGGLDIASAFKSLLRGDGGYFRAVFNAHWSFLNWILRWQSRSVFPKNRQGELRGYYKGNVAWQHFVKGRKTFSEIVRED